VIIRIVRISNLTGQKLTTITADQPLYKRGKELVWKNPTCGNVMLRVGELHVCFNFLKAIDIAEFDDLWIESAAVLP